VAPKQGTFRFMKRWQNIAAVDGFLIVLAFVAERLLRARTSWGDVREFIRDFADLGLFILMNAAILLAIIVILWGGFLLWKEIGPRPSKGMVAEPQYSFAGRFRLVVEVAVLSVVMALAAAGLSKMRTPGWMITGTLGIWSGPLHVDLSIGAVILLAVGVDSAICFAILWGGYLLWQRARRKPAQSSAHRGN
jgi:hypothetical protein